MFVRLLARHVHWSDRLLQKRYAPSSAWLRRTGSLPDTFLHALFARLSFVVCRPASLSDIRTVPLSGNACSPSFSFRRSPRSPTSSSLFLSSLERTLRTLRCFPSSSVPGGFYLDQKKTVSVESGRLGNGRACWLGLWS